MAQSRCCAKYYHFACQLGWLTPVIVYWASLNRKGAADTERGRNKGLENGYSVEITAFQSH